MDLILANLSFLAALVQVMVKNQTPHTIQRQHFNRPNERTYFKYFIRAQKFLTNEEYFCSVQRIKLYLTFTMFNRRLKYVIWQKLWICLKSLGFIFVIVLKFENNKIEYFYSSKNYVRGKNPGYCTVVQNSACTVHYSICQILKSIMTYNIALLQ